MVTVFHVLAACSSLVVASATYISPSALKIRWAYFFAAVMFGSGVYLVIQNTAYLLRACVLGITLLGVILLQLALARRKLASAVVTAQSDQ